MKIDIIELPEKTKIYHLGPPLNAGPRPSVFYFSLSGEESLTKDPYNQPATFLSKKGIRVFSLTIPGHEGAFPHSHALKSWGESMIAGTNRIDEIVVQSMQALDYLILHQMVDPNNIGSSGLSRGAFIATHLAAKDKRFQTVLGFAPLTHPETVKDLNNILNPQILKHFSLETLIPQLIDKTLRFYIGNHDSLVSTSHCFSFIHNLTEYAYRQKHRFPPVELIIYPSIGHKGHGTPPEIFLAGSSWMAGQLKIP